MSDEKKELTPDQQAKVKKMLTESVMLAAKIEASTEQVTDFAKKMRTN